VAASTLPCFGATIPRHLITSWDTNFSDNVGFVFTGVSSISSVDVSRMEASMSSMLDKRREQQVSLYITKCYQTYRVEKKELCMKFRILGDSDYYCQ